VRGCKRGVALWWLSSAMGARLPVFKHMRGVYFNENNIQIRIQTQNYELFVEVFQGLKFCCILSFSNAIHLSAHGTQESAKNGDLYMARTLIRRFQARLCCAHWQALQW